MTIRLIYHDIDNLHAISPFDEAIIATACCDNLRVACPYLSVNYLERITGLSGSWRLITDVEEWLQSLLHSQRGNALLFMNRHSNNIRHFSKLHTKVVIGANAAVLGSANLTDAGIKERTEISILIDEEPEVAELGRWFDRIWDKAFDLPLDRIHAYVKNLPEREPTTSALKDKLFQNSPRASHPLVKLQDLAPLVSSPPLMQEPPHDSAFVVNQQSCIGAQYEYEIVDAILGAYPYSNDDNWLTAKKQVELLRLAYDAKLDDGRNAFPAMHGGLDRGNAPREWNGKARINRMKEHFNNKLASKYDRKSWFMLAKDITPSKIGVSQAVVNKLAEHNIIPIYDVNTIS
jgi:hypothetical protein